MRKIIGLLTVVLLLSSACSIRDVNEGAPDNGGAAGTDSTDIDLVQDATPAPHSELSEIVEGALPSVVNVKVTAVDVAGSEGRGEGSGVIIDPNGIILTNNHVISGAVEVRVLFNDDHESVEGRVIGADPARDLAVVKVDETDLDAIPIGKSSDMKLGDDVVAIGFPLGLGGPTVTKGILSGDGRSISAQSSFGEVERLVDMLQTDAAINPGNSGGALIDMNGNLVGINTAVAGSAENVGFAIAIDKAIPIVEQFLNEPAERQSWLGIQMDDLDPTVAAELGFPTDLSGALIVGVIPRSPAEDAGIEEGSVVTGLDGTGVDSSRKLSELLSAKEPGDRVTLEMIAPDGQRRMVTVELDVRPFQFLRPTPSPSE